MCELLLFSVFNKFLMMRPLATSWQYDNKGFEGILQLATIMPRGVSLTDG